MPRNGSGTFSTVNTFVAGSVITAAGHNQNWIDAAAELTNSLALDGQSTMTGQFKGAVGSLASPGISFSGDLASGFYRPGGSNVCLSLGGVKAIDAEGTLGVQIRGTTVSNDAAAGFVGEFISATVLRASAVAMTSGAALNPTGLFLPLGAGDWEVGGALGFRGEVTTLVQYISGSISQNANARNATPGFETSIPFSSAGVAIYNAFDAQIVLPTVRFALGSFTPIYANAFSGFSVATAAAYGYLWARRRR